VAGTALLIKMNSSQSSRKFDTRNLLVSFKTMKKEETPHR